MISKDWMPADLSRLPEMLGLAVRIQSLLLLRKLSSLTAPWTNTGILVTLIC